MTLLEKLCAIHAPSGNEVAMKEFILDHVSENKESWKSQPQIVCGEEFQDCILLVFGTPRTAIFAHIDSIGFTTRYDNQLVAIGGPEVANNYLLTGRDNLGPIECNLVVDEKHHLFHNFPRGIERGTDLVFKHNYRETKDYIQSQYLDNRMGVYSALKVAETLENGIIAFSCWEEHGGGTVPMLAKYIYEKHGVKQALISDITWITEGIQHGKGVAISIRDSNIPRRKYINRIVKIARESGIKFQLEVEAAGSSDGRELQDSPYPIDWCFIGAPEDNVHSPDEIVHKADLKAMIDLYIVLMQKL